MKVYNIRTNVLDMQISQWNDFNVVLGSQEIITTNVPIFFETIGLVSSHSADTNIQEKEFIKELYDYERSLRRYIMVGNGDSFTPQRFWSWAVCNYEEMLELKERGYSESKNTQYLNKAQ